MSIFVGTNLEVIKEINPKNGEWQNVVVGKSLTTKSAKDKEAICGMCWKNQNQDSILYVTKNRRVKQFKLGDGAARELLHCSPEGAVSAAGICCMDSSERTVIGSEDGTLYLSNLTEVETSWSSGSHLQVLRHDLARHQLLTGGRESDLKLWDASQLSAKVVPIFTAKNVRPDELCLRRPVWVSDAKFHPDARRVLVITGHGDVRIYDPSSPQRRPVFEFRWGEHPLSAMSLRDDAPEQLLVGNTIGQVAALDLRRRGAVAGHFKKITGGVRALACPPGEDPVLVSCASDRFIRFHHLESREMLKEIYLKLKPQVLLIQDNVKFQEQPDDVWDAMPTVQDAKKRKMTD